MITLGEGTYAKVTKGTFNGNPVAIKTFFREEYDEYISEVFIRETAVMKKLNHPYVMSMLSASMEDIENCHIIMPLGKTDLYRFVKEGNVFDVKVMATQIALGVIYLQNSNIFHGDIRPQNIIIMDDNTPKISDFGLCIANACTYDTMWQEANSVNYKSPEMFSNAGYDFSSYSWVFGLLIYFMKNTVELFDITRINNYRKYVENIFHLLGGSNHWSEIEIHRFESDKISKELLFRQRKKPTLTSNYKLNDLLHSTIAINPKNRLSMFEILKHSYFSYNQIPVRKSCLEICNANLTTVIKPHDYYTFAEILDRNYLIPYIDELLHPHGCSNSRQIPKGFVDEFTGIFATALQLYCRFRETRSDISMIDLAIPLVHLATAIHTYTYEDINMYWKDNDRDDLEDCLKIDYMQSKEDIIRIQKEVTLTLNYDLWFSTEIDYARFQGLDLIEARDSLMS